ILLHNQGGAERARPIIRPQAPRPRCFRIHRLRCRHTHSWLWSCGAWKIGPGGVPSSASCDKTHGPSLPAAHPPTPSASVCFSRYTCCTRETPSPPRNTSLRIFTNTFTKPNRSV
ncbi:unnamed protein product, partial [Ectocarpus sp. 6 AP-2014]